MASDEACCDASRIFFAAFSAAHDHSHWRPNFGRERRLSGKGSELLGFDRTTKTRV
jgi:hypothetical protein